MYNTDYKHQLYFYIHIYIYLKNLVSTKGLSIFMFKETKKKSEF